MAEKEQRFGTKEEARGLAQLAFDAAICEFTSTDDTGIDVTKDITLEETSDSFILTRPDVQDGIMIVHYIW